MMAVNKKKLFVHPADFERYLLDNFHGYFRIKEWFYLLILAHQFHTFETNKFMACLGRLRGPWNP